MLLPWPKAAFEAISAQRLSPPPSDWLIVPGQPNLDDITAETGQGDLLIGIAPKGVVYPDFSVDVDLLLQPRI